MKKYLLPLVIGVIIGLSIAGALIAYEFLTTEEHLDPWRPAEAPPREKRQAQMDEQRPVQGGGMGVAGPRWV